jgi:hypothetical protein
VWLGGGREAAVGAGGDVDLGDGDDTGDEDNGATVYRQWLGGGRPAPAQANESVRVVGAGGIGRTGGGSDWVCACGASRDGDELAQSLEAANRAYSHGRALLDGADAAGGGDSDGADLSTALVLLRQAHVIYQQTLHPVNWRRAKCAEDLLSLLLDVGDFEQALPVAMETLGSIEAGLDPGPGPGTATGPAPGSTIAKAATSATAPTSTSTSAAAASPVLAIRQLLVAKLLWWLYEGELEAPRGDRAKRASSAKGAALLREARAQLKRARLSLIITHGEESAMYAQLMELHDRAIAGR